MASELAATIHLTLQGYNLPSVMKPYFAKVFKGEPIGLMPGSSPQVRWNVARSETPPEGPRVVTGTRQTAVVFNITCYWPLSASEGAQQSQEDDIATVLIDLPRKFIALTATDYTIGGYPVSLLTVEDTSTVQRASPFGDAEMRMLEFELHARVLEA